MERFKRLDGLRGVLAVYVMLGHALPFTAAPALVQGLFSHGEAAVELFFALSGLVIINSVERFGGRFFPFMAARGRRLLPVYFLALGAAVAVLAAGEPVLPWVGAAGRHIWEAGLPSPLWAHVAAHVFLVQGLIPQAVLPFAYVTLLGPAWSLSTEWQFYLVLGFWAPKRLVAGAYALMGLGVFYHLFFAALFSRAFLLGAAPFFALGLASAAWLRGEGVGCLVVCTVLAAGLGVFEGAGKFAVPLLWGVVMLAQGHSFGRVLESRVVQFLGAISYPLYLFNEPVQRGLAMVLPVREESAFSVVWLPLGVVCAVAVAAFVHYLVEVPFSHPRPWQKIHKVFLVLFVHKKSIFLTSK